MTNLWGIRRRFIRGKERGFLGGPAFKNLPSNAGVVGLIPSQRTKVPRALEQLNPWATTRETWRPHGRPSIDKKEKAEGKSHIGEAKGVLMVLFLALSLQLLRSPWNNRLIFNESLCIPVNGKEYSVLHRSYLTGENLHSRRRPLKLCFIFTTIHLNLSNWDLPC